MNCLYMVANAFLLLNQMHCFVDWKDPYKYLLGFDEKLNVMGVYVLFNSTSTYRSYFFGRQAGIHVLMVLQQSSNVIDVSLSPGVLVWCYSSTEAFSISGNFMEVRVLMV